jgi:hypothetical protein
LAGLSAILQLQPIGYAYKPENALGLNGSGEYIGFSAQAVAKVIPEAIQQNTQGYLLLNNDPIIWAAVNAIKEQQVVIESLREDLRQAKQQQELIRQQQAKIEALKKVVCLDHPEAEMCRT